MTTEATFGTERARELLPWLLNGTLDEGERGELLAALRRSPELRRELAETQWAGRLFAQHLPTADVVAYAFGTETATERALVEGHLASCTECRDELTMVRESLTARDADRDAYEGAGADETDPATGADVVPFGRPATPPPPLVGVSPVWRMVAMAAGLIAVLGVGGWLNTWQQAMSRSQGLMDEVSTRSAQVSDLTASLEAAALAPAIGDGEPVGDVGFATATVRAAADGPKPLLLSSLDGTAELRFLPESGPGKAIYEVRLLHGEERRELLRITPLLPGEDEVLRAYVAAERLPQGVLTAVLYRADPDGGWREVERHAFEVELGEAGPGG